MRALSLFSGCGGCDFALQDAGVTVAYANEIADDACATLERYFPHAEIDRRDIRQIKSFPSADLICGGYPCQSFSMGGNRDPEKDERTTLFREFARSLALVNPLYFIAENVSGLKKIDGGRFLLEQSETFRQCGVHGYRVSTQLLDAKDYGVPQSRKRVFLVGVRSDLQKVFKFPAKTHGVRSRKAPRLLPFTSHGECIRDLPLWPAGEFYERPHDPEGHWSWYYMSRNRKAAWDGPSYTIVANWRHVTLHPGSPVMKMTWSDLANGWKQRWDFTDEYEHLAEDPSRPSLEAPRRLSWRECARIQGFPLGFEPIGDTESKYEQVGNAVPPLLFKKITEHLISGVGLKPLNAECDDFSEQLSDQLLFNAEAAIQPAESITHHL
ncbi:MAG: DNA cytosine methyltransferase [Blastocatellia bacterium]|nr:DNA cytosine methyltransferase [Blastocatellia bacterium]